jgi:hypothetical protein
MPIILSRCVRNEPLFFSTDWISTGLTIMWRFATGEIADLTEGTFEIGSAI